MHWLHDFRFEQGLIEDCRRKEIYKDNPQNLVDVFLEKIDSETDDPDTSFTGSIR